MPLMYTFCTWLPLRLGTIVVGLISVIQSTAIGIVCVMSLNMTDTVSREINRLLRSNNMVYTTDMWKAVEKDPRAYITNVTIYFSLHAVSCVALIYGALKSSIVFILPYILVELVRLVVIFYVVLTSMILIKINVLDFLFLILVSVIGVFFLQILIYLWCCPVSLVQCLILVKTSAAAQPRETVEEHNNGSSKTVATAAATAVTANNNQDVVSDPLLTDHYGWRPFKPSYSYPYENMPRYEY